MWRERGKSSFLDEVRTEITQKVEIQCFFVQTHGEQQGWYRSAACDVNHGQQTREMAFPRSGEKQPERQKQRQFSPESRASWYSLTVCTAEGTAQETHQCKGRLQKWPCRVKYGPKQEYNGLRTLGYVIGQAGSGEHSQICTWRKFSFVFWPWNPMQRWASTLLQHFTPVKLVIFTPLTLFPQTYLKIQAQKSAREQEKTGKKEKARQPQELEWEEREKRGEGEDKLTATTWRGSHWPPRRWRVPQRWAWSMTLLLAISLQMSGRNIRSREREKRRRKTQVHNSNT